MARHGIREFRPVERAICCGKPALREKTFGKAEHFGGQDRHTQEQGLPPEEARIGRLLQKEQGFPMTWKRMVNYFRYPLLAAVAVFGLVAAEHRGVVKFGAVPVPGATVTATQGDKKLVAVTGQDGAYAFPELADGVWNLQVDMLCFAPLKREIGISPGAPAAEWDLKMLPMDQIKPETPAPSAPPTAAAAAAAAQPGATPAAATAPAAAAPAA